MAQELITTEYLSLFYAMKLELLKTPPPLKMDIKEVTRLSISNVDAVSVMHGWVTRVLRTGEATLQLKSAGFTTEVSPLVRSMIEHAIGLTWMADQRGVALQVLIRSESEHWKRVEKAQESGWKISGEDAQELLKNSIEMTTDEETRSFDFLGHVKHQAEKYELGALYQAWLIETSTSHASIISAEPYFKANVTTNNVALLRKPKDMGEETEAAVVIALFFAINAYNQILEGTPLDSKISEWNSLLQSLASRLAVEHAKVGRIPH